MSLPRGVDIIGQMPKRGKQLLILSYSSHTERDLLQKFLKGNFSSGHTLTAWSWEDRHGDHLQHRGLIEALDGPDDLEIIPVGIAWRPKSGKQQSWREIAAWMRLTESNFRQGRVLRSNPGRCAVIIGESGTRKTLEQKFRRFSSADPVGKTLNLERFANFMSLQAALTLDRDARHATGQTIKYPRYVKRSIWGRRDFQEKLKEIAEETGEPLDKVREEARDCLKELIPKVRASHVSFSTVFARWVCRLGYEEKIHYDKDGMKAVREMALTRPTALMWTHKTHIDGFAIMLASREENFPLVHTIGGNNMAFFGIGYLMSRVGTVFIRRTIDSPVYKIVLRSYLSYLLEKRFPISWALEGTRSRNGKLMPPRFGILKYVVEAAAKENTKDLALVPISIYYDLIAELGDYAREQAGQKKRKESLAWFTEYLQSLRKPLGRVSLGLGAPVIVDTTDQVFANAMEGGSSSLSIELQKLAFVTSVNANAATPITPSSLLSLALTGAAPRALLRDELQDRVLALLDWAKSRGLPITKDLWDLDGDRVRSIMRSMIEIDVVTEFDEGPETVYAITQGKHFEASYYRNNAIHVFVTKALIEVALAKAAEVDGAQALDVFWDEVIKLRNVFKFEFFYPNLDTHRQQIAEEIERYDTAWPSTMVAGNAAQLLDKFTPLISHAVLRPFAEAYSIVADVLVGLPSGVIAEEKDIVNRALKFGKQAFLQRRITSEESIGKLMFSNGYKLAANRGLTDGEGDTDIEAADRATYVDDMNDITRRLQLIGDIAAKKREQRRIDSQLLDIPKG